SFFARLMARALSSFFCSTSSGCLPGGDCLPGFLLICRCQSHKAGVVSASWVRLLCLSCSTCLVCFPVTSALAGLRTIWAAADLSCSTFLPPLFWCRFTPGRVLRQRCLCWGRLSLSSGRDFFPARASSAARSSLPAYGRGPWALPITARAP